MTPPATDFKNSDTVKKEIFKEFPEVRKFWQASEEKRRIALMFVRIRTIAGLSQKELADEADWDKAFVSRLEGAQGGIPDLHTVTRYASVCGLKVSIVVSTSASSEQIDVVDAITLGTKSIERNPILVEHLRHHHKNLETSVADSVEG